MERDNEWEHVSEEHIGKVLRTKSELETLTTTCGRRVGHVTERRIDDNYKIFEALVIEGSSKRVPIAYECGFCDSIIIGSPEKREELLVAMDESGYSAGAGAVKINYHCGSCGEKIYG